MLNHVMDLKNIPVRYQPAYTWLWNSTVTRDGIKARIDEMHDAGIRAFYVIGEPENFRPNARRTHLSPKYLSAEYIDLLYYAYETAKKGVCTPGFITRADSPRARSAEKFAASIPSLV
jgi:hypothetical protein